jgi:hypothetical protein
MIYSHKEKPCDFNPQFFSMKLGLQQMKFVNLAVFPPFANSLKFYTFAAYVKKHLYTSVVGLIR